MTDQPDLLMLLHDLARQVRVDADRRARIHGLTRAQWVILWRLQQQSGLSQKELAEIVEVEPITIARLIDRLEERGMVERRDDPADRRIWRLHLRAAAYPVLEALGHERAAMLDRVTDGLPPALTEALKDGLRRMKANIVAGPAPRATEPAAYEALRTAEKDVA